MTTCSIEGCSKEHLARGWCSKHYKKWRKYGDPLAFREIHKKGEGWINDSGYRVIGDRREHRSIAEKSLGESIQKGSCVHHLDENRLNNDPSNLIICNSIGSHTTLHRKKRALKECGHEDWRKCPFCKEYDDPENMSIGHSGKGSTFFFHSGCHNKYRRERWK